MGMRDLPQRVPARIELKPAQKTVLAALDEGRLGELTRSGYQELTGMSRSQAAYDLADLVEAGILERFGGGRSTRYRLAGHPAGKRRWTSDRIRSELIRFCETRRTWPSAAEFKASGRGDLYVAASRYGGIGYWAAQLGFPKHGEGRPPRRLLFAVAGAVAGAALVGASGIVVRHWPAGSTNRDATPAQKPAHKRAIAHVPRTPKHAIAPRSTVKRPAAPRRRAAHILRHESTPAVSTSVLVIRTTRTVTPSANATARARTSGGGSGPSPLRAPSSPGDAPAPLAAPG
jgi:DNA-binding transcriptional ArsR family regulator